MFFTGPWQRRYTLVGLGFAATFICYIDRVNISVAIIPMAAQYGWNATTQGAVLSSFFVGYLLTQVVGGRLADRFGGKVVLAGGVLLWSLFTIVTPPAAAFGFTALLLARVGMGMGEGVNFPAMYTLQARWIPLDERARAMALSNSGIPLGTVFALAVTPIVVTHLGWQWAFYLFGSVGLVWFVFWQRGDRRVTGATSAYQPRGTRAHSRALDAGGRTWHRAADRDIPQTSRRVGDHRRALLQQLVAVHAADVAADVRHERSRRRLQVGRRASRCCRTSRTSYFSMSPARSPTG